MRIGIALLLAALLAGCAGNPADPESALKGRVQERWDALISEDWEGAYSYLSPGYRSANSSRSYMARMRNHTVRWLEAEVVDVECDASEGTAEACKVRTRLKFRVPVVAPGIPGTYDSVQVVVENWIRSGGKWYFVPKIKSDTGLS